ncbi:MAG TPA: pirin family protein [Acidimicrobiales bacterium]|nr:pirin family protein [Acidimicrobiales bacterium]
MADERATRGAQLIVTDSRATQVGEFDVRRALPTRGRRTVGPWCFIDHLGPATFSPTKGFDIAPHPHLGLQTVTWLFDGAILHRDSLGSEQLIRPGQMNLMTSGEGIAHSEENPGVTTGQLHGIQLWVALPSSTRHGPSAFEHHEELPRFEMPDAEATVLVGSVGSATSSARRDSEAMGVELRLERGRHLVPLVQEFEYAMVVTSGEVVVDGTMITPGHLAYLGRGRDEVGLTTNAPAVAMLLGGVPFEETIMMWWNFVARTQEEITAAYESWMKDDDRFGRVASSLARIEVGPPPWFRSTR